MANRELTEEMKRQLFSELGKRSAKARREKAGGKEAFRKQMQEYAKRPRKKLSTE